MEFETFNLLWWPSWVYMMFLLMVLEGEDSYLVIFMASLIAPISATWLTFRAIRRRILTNSWFMEND